MMGDGGAAKGAAFGTLQATERGGLQRCGCGGHKKKTGVLIGWIRGERRMAFSAFKNTGSLLGSAWPWALEACEAQGHVVARQEADEGGGGEAGHAGFIVAQGAGNLRWGARGESRDGSL